ncbi:hypothetical protein C8R44DRAFT_990350 [Mycena epipterygia]|nr:hypothetical protein C8R44DRAFT_990350 [Mycena epipterygia]
MLSVLSGAVNEDHERAKTAVTNFLSVIQLEVDRRDNDEAILAVCYSMTSMISVLRYSNREDQSMDALDTHMVEMSCTIKDFGAFVDVYYSRCASWIVRYQRSAELQQTLKNFDDRFRNLESDLGEQMQIPDDQSQTAQTSGMERQIKILIGRIGTARTDKQKQALEKIHLSYNILDTDHGIAQIAAILKESVTSSMVDALHDDFARLLDQKSVRYELKLRGTRMMLEETMERSTEKILNRMDAGPHDLLGEPDIKKIWQDNKWGVSVKCRVFADALSNYYTEKFRKSPADDMWTLKILSKVLYYPAIGEAIDEDASGFVSVHELDHFLKKNKDGLSTPVWFALWAVGPPVSNTWYTERIEDLAKAIEEMSQNIKDTDRNLSDQIDEYLETLRVVAGITGWNTWGVSADGLEELDTDTRNAVESLALGVAAENEELFRCNLERLRYAIDEGTLRGLTEGAGARMEQNIMILLYLLLSKHAEIISAGMGDMTGFQFASEFADMDLALWTLAWEFQRRYTSIERSWRSQRLDIELQVRSYAGGLFNGWFKYYNAKPDVIDKVFYELDEEEPDDENSENTPTIDAKVDQLSKRVAALDARLDTRLDAIESMLKKLMGMGVVAAQSIQSTRGNLASSEDGRGNDDDPANDEAEPTRHSETGGEFTGDDANGDDADEDESGQLLEEAGNNGSSEEEG